MGGIRKSETRIRKPETRNRKPETGNQKPETRNQNPESGNKKPESGNRKTEFRIISSAHSNRHPERTTAKRAVEKDPVRHV